MRKLTLGLFAGLLLGGFSSSHAAPIVWTNTAGGNWSVAANWSPNQTPGAGDVAWITNSGDYVVTLDVSATIAGLNVGGIAGNPTLIISGPTLTLNGTGVVGTNAFLSVLSGTLNGAGSWVVSGVFNLFGGSFGGSGLLSVQPGGDIRINGGVAFGNRPLLNAGRILWTAGNASGLLSVTNLGLFDIIADGGSFTCSQGFTNAGTMRRLTGTGTVNINSPFDNGGAVQVGSGTVALQRGGTESGSFSVDPGATLAIGMVGLNDVMFFMSGSTVTAAGNLLFNGATSMQVTFTGNMQSTGAITVDSGTVFFFSGCALTNTSITINGGVANFNTGKLLTPGTFNLNGGTYAGTDPLTCTNLMNLNGVVQNIGTINANGGLTMSAQLRGGTLNNAGIAFLGSVRFASNAVLNNLVTGTVYLNDTLIKDFGPLTPGSHTVNNFGSLLKTNNSDSISISVPFNNSGTVDVQQGSLFVFGGGIHSGSFQVAAGAVLNFGLSSSSFAAPSLISGAGSIGISGSVDVLGNLNVGGNVSISGGSNSFDGIFAANGNVAITGGINSFTGSFTNGGLLSVANGVAYFNTGSPIISGQLTVSSGTVAGNDPINVSGPTIWNGGTLAGLGAIHAGGGLSLGGSTLILNGRTLINGGAGVWNGGTLFTGAGSLISNAPSGTFDIAFNGQTLGGFGNPRTFANAGLLRKTGGSGTALISDAFFNTGTVEVMAGTLSFGNTFIQTAGATRLNGGNLAATGPLQILGGTLAGSGIVNAAVTNSGQCSPGTSPGSLQINGDYTQTPSGQLNIEIGGTIPGTSFDQINISGTATLNGTLNVSSFNGFHPTQNDSFRVMNFGFRTGDFASFNDSTGSALTRVYDATGLALVASGGSPVLSINLAGGVLQISWPSNDFILQFTTNLASPVWLDVANNTNTYYASPTEPEGFFRLIQP